jgi:hypothetical protein
MIKQYAIKLHAGIDAHGHTNQLLKAGKAPANDAQHEQFSSRREAYMVFTSILHTLLGYKHT